MIFQAPDPGKLSQPSATDNVVVAISRDLLAVLSALALLFGILWTIARSWTRDRLYNLLESKPETHAKFVMDVIDNEEHRNEVGTVVLDMLNDNRHRDRFRAIIAELYDVELGQLRNMHHNIAELGLRTGEMVMKVSAMEDLTHSFAKAQSESARTSAVLAESVRSMSDSMSYIRGEMGKLNDKIDRTQEIIISRTLPGPGNRRPNQF